MKRSSTVLLLILAALAAAIFLVTYGWARKVNAMTVRFNVKDIPEHGLDLVTSADPAFPQLLSRYLNDNGKKHLSETVPFSAFLVNRGKKHVVAYVIKWEMRGINGQTTTQFSSYSQPGILLGYRVNIPTAPGQRHVISPGSLRLFSPNAPIDPEGKSALGSVSAISPKEDLDYSIRPIDRARSAVPRVTDITVSLDGAFFDDGQFVGPNTSHYFERIKAETDAKRDLLAQMVEADKKPGGLDQAFDALQTPVDEEPPLTYVEATPEAQYQYYAKAYSREIIEMKNAYGKEKAVAHIRALHSLRKPKLTKTPE
jgi:hypothetical protein